MSEADDINKAMKDIYNGGIKNEIVNAEIKLETFIGLLGLYYFRN